MQTRKVRFPSFQSNCSFVQKARKSRFFGFCTTNGDRMPAKITLREVLPVLWREMNLDPMEKERALNRAKFDQYMTTTETIVHPKTLDRMWKTLTSSRFAQHSPYYDNVIVLDVQAVKLVLDDAGILPFERTHTSHTHTLATTVQKVLPPREGA